MLYLTRIIWVTEDFVYKCSGSNSFQKQFFVIDIWNVTFRKRFYLHYKNIILVQIILKRTGITVSRLVRWWRRGDWPLEGSLVDSFFFYFDIFYITILGNSEENFPEVKVQPDAGLEPATVGLKVQRSTDWANQARRQFRRSQIVFQWMLNKSKPVESNARTRDPRTNRSWITQNCWFGPKFLKFVRSQISLGPNRLVLDELVLVCGFLDRIFSLDL